MSRSARLALVAISALVAVPGLYQLGLLAVTVSRRFLYPYDLEWMEGGVLEHAQRYLDGHDLYVAPSVDFMAFLYTPVYPALLAALSFLGGLTYQLGRAVSLVAMVATAAAMLAIPVREATREQRPIALAAGVVAVGFWAATYPWVEGWYDLVRGDSLFVALVLAGLLVLRRAVDDERPGYWQPRAALAAALLALSFFTKQTGFLFTATGGLLLLLYRPRALPVYVVVAGVLGLGGTWLYDRASGGWFWVYAFGYHGQHEVYLPRFWDSFRLTVTRYWTVSALVGLGLITVGVRAALTRSLGARDRGFLFWFVVFLAGLAVGALGWSRQWAHFNAFVVTMVTAAIAAACAVVVIADSMPARLAVLAALLLAAQGVELWRVRWSPKPFVPARADRAAGDRLIARLRSAPGDVFVPFHPWYARLAGKSGHIHRMGLLDAAFRPPPAQKRKPVPPAAQRVAGLAESFAQRRWAMIVLDDKAQLHELPGLEAHYRLAEKLPGNERPRVFTGAHTTPATVWLPSSTSP